MQYLIKNNLYVGSLNPKKMIPLIRKAYIIYSAQRCRNTVQYTAREFIPWYVKEFTKKKWKRAHVARFDHDKGYSFSNIEMQEQLENNRERNARCGNPGKSHKKVSSYCRKTGKKLKTFKSKVEAAKFYGLDVKTIYNWCNGKTKNSNKGGPITSTRKVFFRWNTK